jgi:hypothetical protein
MQTLFHNDPLRLDGTLPIELPPQLALLNQMQPVQVVRTVGRWLVDSYDLILKLILIACVLSGFFQLVAYVLTLSDSPLVQIPALAAWACGAIPLLYRLWWLDLRRRPSVDR